MIFLVHCVDIIIIIMIVIITINIAIPLRRPRHCLHSRDASRLNCLHGAIPIALAASDFPFRLLLNAVTHVLSVFRVCKVP